jgi:hypothetical protein
MKKISILIVTLVIVALAVFVAVGLDGNQAMALPSYVQPGAATCGACHVNTAGGGALTPLGTAFAANGHVLPTTTTAGGSTTTTAGGSTTTTAHGSTTTTVTAPTGGSTSTSVHVPTTSTTVQPTTTTTVPEGEPSFTG